MSLHVTTDSEANLTPYGSAVLRQVNLKDVQRQDRIAKCKELAELNRRDGASWAAESLMELRAKLLARRVDIPAHVSHGDLESWAQGRGPQMW